MRSAHRGFSRCVDLCRAHGLGRLEVATLYMVGVSGSYLLPVTQALISVEQCVELAARVAHHRAELLARSQAAYFRGWLLGEIELQCHCPFVSVGPEGRSAAEALARQLDLPPEHAGTFPLALCGSVDELCDALVHRRERWGFSYTIVPSDRMEAFAPVVARLAGS